MSYTSEMWHDLTHPLDAKGKKLLWVIGMYVAIFWDIVDSIASIVDWIVGAITGGVGWLAIGELYDTIGGVISVVFFGWVGLIPFWEIFEFTEVVDVFVPSLVISGMLAYYLKFYRASLKKGNTEMTLIEKTLNVGGAEKQQ